MRHILALFLLLITLPLAARLRTVALDGSGNYTTIQNGINASADGDTVLVMPGRYLENVRFNGRDITLTSRYIYTNNWADVDSTIIDGHQSGSCVRIINNETNAVLVGFTLEHGNGTLWGDYTIGGGIFCYMSSAVVKSLVIQYNSVTSGSGGLSVFSGAYVSVDNCTIRYNLAKTAGAGISVTNDGTVEFDEDNPSSIYCNSSPYGSDIYFGSDTPTSIYLDKFTNDPRDPHFFLDRSHQSQVFYNELLYGNSDTLYVSPTGSNDNDGLTPETPLKNIYAANWRMAGSQPHTIYLADGTYSQSATGEYFPLSARSNFSCIGQSKYGTILDGEGANVYAFMCNDAYNTYENAFFGSFSIINFMDRGFFLYNYQTVTMKNMLFQNLDCTYTDGGYTSSHPLSVTFDGCEIRDMFASAISTGRTSLTYIRNCVIDVPASSGTVNGLILDYSRSSCYLYNNLIVIRPGINSSASNNPSVVEKRSAGNLFAFNNTIVHMGTRTAKYILNVYDGDGGANYFYNNIICSQNAIPFGSGSYSIEAFNNCLNFTPLAGDTDPFYTQYGSGDPGTNLLATDPLFADDSTYVLMDASPCVDSGWDDFSAFTGYTQPQCDLWGSPRVWGDHIDIGAAEYRVVGQNEQLAVNVLTAANYPNPFNPSTTIKFNMPQAGKAELAVYNVRGQKVRTLINDTRPQGVQTMVFNGRDDAGNTLASGVYLYRVTACGKSVTKKMLMVK